MATFQSLTPPMGSHQFRNAPDLFSIELELALPQDHFLPAENIIAEVWTNIIQRLNTEGPEVWAAVPMKLTHVIPGTSTAVFAARLQPTGRGEFGLTARWKAHKDLTEWQWAPVATAKGTNDGAAGSIGREAGEKVNKDVSVSVKVPRNISSSPWTLGPQSVMVFGQDGPRVAGMSVKGPGLYLGNHAAATRARISGYESVLSLVGGLVDFDQDIPESDKDVNRKAWLEQEKAKTKADNAQRHGRFPSFSSSSSISFYGGGGDSVSDNLSRRSSVMEFMKNYEPGSNASGNNVDMEELFAAVVDEPVDPPRLTRKSSVTEMMVQPPPPSSPKNLFGRSSVSTKPFRPAGESGQESGQQVVPATAAPNTGSAKTIEAAKASEPKGVSSKTPPVSQGKNGSTPTATAAAAVASASATAVAAVAAVSAAAVAAVSAAPAAAVAAVATAPIAAVAAAPAAAVSTAPASAVSANPAAAVSATPATAVSATSATRMGAAKLPPASSATTTPVSEKSGGNSSSNNKKNGKKDSHPPAVADAKGAASLSGSNAKVTKTGSVSPTVASLGVAAASESTAAKGSIPQNSNGSTTKGVNGANGGGGGSSAVKREDTTATTESDSSSSEKPNSITKVVSGLYRQSLESQQARPSLSYLNNFSSSTSGSHLASSASSSSLANLESPASSSPDLAAQSSSMSPPAGSSNGDVDKQGPLKPPFKHKVISLAPGAHSVISDANLKEAVEFLTTEISLGKRVLVHCRDGNGRSGSIAIAYVASQLEKNAEQQQQTVEQKEAGGYYEEALKEVWKWKCDVYPHKGLKQSLARIQW